jgi:hypothetical protein
LSRDRELVDVTYFTGRRWGENPLKNKKTKAQPGDREKTLKQIQGDNLAEKTRMRENLKTNPRRKPYRENKDGRKP